MLTDFQTSVLLRLQTLEEAQIEMLQLLRSLIGVNKTAEELDEVLPASTHEQLGRLCERLVDQTFKKQLVCVVFLDEGGTKPLLDKTPLDKKNLGHRLMFAIEI